MSVFKCKMCGGTLEIQNGESVAVCEYCGTKQTIPKGDNDVITNLFNRANNLRIKCEFDKAEAIYEKILEQDNTEAEAHWGIILCKYGIEYVEDPKTLNRVPTCHRTSFESVTASAEYLAAMEYADSRQREIYEREAKIIDNIQKNILNIVKNEKPFDVFICYKETDLGGRRTVDSTIANDIYYQLTQEGLKVFYAAITLEDKLGQEYEPYIFAALNSAKVMLAIGTKPEYFESVWVKNEWSRFMKLMKTDRSKLLIPCYRDMDPYDLPEEFAHLQAQDMGKIGFINDVVRGIKKVVVKDEPKAAAAYAERSVPTSGSDARTTQLLKRAFMFLEDGDFTSANEYCEKVLDYDAENAEAYLCKLCVELKVTKKEKLAELENTFEGNANYIKALRFADIILRKELEGYIETIKEHNETDRKDNIYKEASALKAKAKTFDDFIKAMTKFDSIRGYKDSAELSEECTYLANKAKAEAEEKARHNKKVASIVIPIILLIAAVCFVLFGIVFPMMDYNKALELVEAEQFDEAVGIFTELEGYKDSADQIKITYAKKAVSLLEEGKTTEAAETLDIAMESESAKAVIYEYADEFLAEEKFDESIFLFDILGGISKDKSYEDSFERTQEAKYKKAKNLYDSGKYAEAYPIFEELANYEDSDSFEAESRYKYGNECIERGAYEEALEVMKPLRSSKFSDIYEKRYLCNEKLAEEYFAAKEYIKALKCYLESGVIDEKSETYKMMYYHAGVESAMKKTKDGYKTAVSYFEKANGYEDSKKKLKETKYAYVKASYTANDTMTYYYLKDLKDAGYEDSAKLFKELYKLSITGYFHDEKGNKVTSYSKGTDYAGAWFTLTGGEPGKKYTLSHCTVYPNGNTVWSDWYWEDETRGSKFGCEWDTGWNSITKGTLTIKVYNKATGEFIGSVSVKITG